MLLSNYRPIKIEIGVLVVVIGWFGPNTAMSTEAAAPKPKVDNAAHAAFVPTMKAARAAMEATPSVKIGGETVVRAPRSPFHPLTRDVVGLILSQCTIMDLCNIRKTSASVAMYMRSLPLHVMFPRHFNCFQQHVFLMMFPGTRVLKFQLLPKTNIEGWKLILSVVPNPQLDLSNVTYDVLCDKAGRDLYSIGAYNQALMCFLRALEIPTPKKTEGGAPPAPLEDDDVIRHNLGTTLHALGRCIEARTHLEYAYGKSPDARTSARLGDTLVALGDSIGGLALLEKAVAMTDGGDAALLIRAKMYARTSNVDLAIADYTKLTDTSRDKVDDNTLREFAAFLEANQRTDDAAKIRARVPEPMKTS